MDDNSDMPGLKKIYPPMSVEDIQEQIRKYNSVSPALHDEFLLMDYTPKPSLWDIVGFDKDRTGKYSKLFEDIRHFMLDKKETAYPPKNVIYHNWELLMLPELSDEWYQHSISASCRHVYIPDSIMPVMHASSLCEGKMYHDRLPVIFPGIHTTATRSSKTSMLQFFMDECVYPFVKEEIFSIKGDRSKPYWLKYVPLKKHFGYQPPTWLSIKHIGKPRFTDMWLNHTIATRNEDNDLSWELYNIYQVPDCGYDISNFPSSKTSKSKAYWDDDELPYYRRLRK